MKKMFLAAAAAMLLVGCAAPKNWSADGGSRADGTVRLAYEWGGFEVPKVDENQAIEVATQRCTAWGYTGAEAFGEGRGQCISRDAFGCASWRRVREFQCLGTPPVSK